MTDLERYAAHDQDCGTEDRSDPTSSPCTCGLAEAIEREKNEQPIAHTGGSATPHLVTWLGRKWVPLDDLKEARAQLAQAREALEDTVYKVKRAVREAIAGSGLGALAANAAESAIRAALEGRKP